MFSFHILLIIMLSYLIDELSKMEYIKIDLLVCLVPIFPLLSKPLHSHTHLNIITFFNEHTIRKSFYLKQKQNNRLYFIFQLIFHHWISWFAQNNNAYANTLNLFHFLVINKIKSIVY